MHFSSLLTLALATIFTDVTSAVKPPKSKEFALAFSIRNAKNQEVYLSANVVRNNSKTPSLVLVGRSQNRYGGSPAYLNGTNPTAALNYDLTNVKDAHIKKGVYGASVPDLGSAYGNVGGVSLTLNYQDNNWGAINGSVYHKLYSAFNAFFACQGNVNGKKVWILSFGVYNQNSSPPTGCQSTKVIQLYDIPGGLLPSSPPSPTPTP